VRRAIDWLIASFDPQKFPWFRDEFIHPRDLPEQLEGEALVNMFAGFGGRPGDEEPDRYYRTG